MPSQDQPAPWGSRDVARLRRAVDKFETHTEAAKALGISKTALSRYRDGTQKPAGMLTVSALRDGIARVLQGVENKSSKKQAGP